METELIKTFLDVVTCKSFVGAAQRLNVAQTTVSARIRTLEERLGRQLFVRHKGGATLTPAGERLLRHAPDFIQIWERMQRNVAMSGRHSALATIGGEINLWQPTLLDWLGALRRQRPDIALNIEVNTTQHLIENLAAGLIDAAVMHAPPHRPGVKTDLLLDEKLVLVTSDPGRDPFENGGFFGLDWGPGFRQEFASCYPDAPAPAISANLGRLALHYVLEHGGAGYFRGRIVQPFIAAGQLHPVRGAASFAYPIYVASCADTDPALLDPVLSALHQAVAEAPEPA